MIVGNPLTINFKEVFSSIEGDIIPVLQANEEAATSLPSNIQTLNYQFGHIGEIIQTLTGYNMTAGNMFGKFPLCWLLEDITYRSRPGAYTEADVTLIFAYATRPEITSAEREEQVFIPILRPLVNATLKAIGVSRFFEVAHMESLNVDYTERKYWGTQQVSEGKNNTGNKLNEYVDAIEVKISGLSLNENCFFPVNRD
jgi:hypothetical protein